MSHVEAQRFEEKARNAWRPVRFILWATLDFGRKPWRWVWASLVIAVFFAVLYMPTPTWFPEWWASPLRFDYPVHYNPWFAPFYFSVVTFTTLGFGDFAPANVPAQLLVMLEVVFGYIMLGVLLALISSYLRR